VAELISLGLVAALYPPILAIVVVLLARPNPRNLLTSGHKESGFGGEDGKHGVPRYTQLRSVYHYYG
jgi:hypothetical protein